MEHILAVPLQVAQEHVVQVIIALLVPRHQLNLHALLESTVEAGPVHVQLVLLAITALAPRHHAVLALLEVISPILVKIHVSSVLLERQVDQLQRAVLTALQDTTAMPVQLAKRAQQEGIHQLLDQLRAHCVHLEVIRMRASKQAARVVQLEHIRQVQVHQAVVHVDPEHSVIVVLHRALHALQDTVVRMV